MAVRIIGSCLILTLLFILINTVSIEHQQLSQTHSIQAQHVQFQASAENWQEGQGDDISEHVRVADMDKDGKISYDEHVKFFKDNILEPTDDPEDWEDHLYHYYKFLDSDKNGEVSYHEYHNLYNAPDLQESQQI